MTQSVTQLGTRSARTSLAVALIFGLAAWLTMACTAPRHVQADAPLDEAGDGADATTAADEDGDATASDDGADASDESEESDGRTEATGIRFTRADLVDVATYVSDRTGTGFVLGEPSLRTVTLSLYMPHDVTPEQAEEMFLTALESLDIAVYERDGYWLITEPDSRLGGVHGGVDGPGYGLGHADDVQITFDFRAARLDEVTAFLSAISGKQIVMRSDLPDLRLTVQALSPVSRVEAVAILTRALTSERIEIDSDGDVLVLSRERTLRPRGTAEEGGDADVR